MARTDETELARKADDVRRLRALLAEASTLARGPLRGDLPQSHEGRAVRWEHLEVMRDALEDG